MTSEFTSSSTFKSE